MVQKLLNSKQKILKFSVKQAKEFSVDNMKKTGLNVYVYDFRVDYDAIAIDDILDIRKYFMKKNGIA